MNDFTSFDVSERLMKAGFVDKDAAQELSNLDGKGNETWVDTYRSDTLLAWLTDRGYWVKIYPKVGTDCIAAAGHYPVRFRGKDQATGRGENTPDALAEVVIQVMGKTP